MKTILNEKRFFKDTQHAKISGVCAGIAKYFGIDPWIARGIAIAAFLYFPVAVGLAYVMAMLLLSEA